MGAGKGTQGGLAATSGLTERSGGLAGKDVASTLSQSVDPGGVALVQEGGKGVGGEG